MEFDQDAAFLQSENFLICDHGIKQNESEVEKYDFFFVGFLAFSIRVLFRL